MDWFLYDREIRHEKVNSIFWVLKMKLTILCRVGTRGRKVQQDFNDEKLINGLGVITETSKIIKQREVDVY